MDKIEEDFLADVTEFQKLQRFDGYESSRALRIHSDSSLTSPVEADAQYDSNVEENFAKEWGEAARDGWTLLCEDVVPSHGQKLFITDFVLRKDDGTKVIFEIAGFWSEKYWRRKRESLAVFADRRIGRAIPQSIEAKDLEIVFPVIRYVTKLKVKQVLECMKLLQRSSMARP